MRNNWLTVTFEKLTSHFHSYFDKLNNAYLTWTSTKLSVFSPSSVCRYEGIGVRKRGVS